MVKMMQEQWHNTSVEQVLKGLETKRFRLSQAEATARLSGYGPNELKGEKK